MKQSSLLGITCDGVAWYPLHTVVDGDRHLVSVVWSVRSSMQNLQKTKFTYKIKSSSLTLFGTCLWNLQFLYI